MFKDDNTPNDNKILRADKSDILIGALIEWGKFFVLNFVIHLSALTNTIGNAVSADIPDAVQSTTSKKKN